MEPLRLLVVRALRPRLSGSFLPYPLRVAGAALALTVLLGCSSAVKTTASIQVARDFYRNRHTEVCHAVQFPKWCVGFDVLLNKTDRDLDEATAALVWVRTAKAAMPLQLKAITTDAKALKAGYKP
jgi:hypothetical protein